MKKLFVAATSFAAGLVIVMAACMDTTPFFVTPPDASAKDNLCVQCLESPEGCADLISQCRGDPLYTQCGPAYDCMVARTCLDLPTLDDKIRCGLPCAQEAGVQSTTDPIITTYLLGLVVCGQQKCAKPCNLEGGAP